MKYIILIPIYNDRESLKILIENINSEIKDLNNDISLVVINDASSQQIIDTYPNIENIQSIEIVNMKQNRGHARCIASGLKYIFEKKDFDFVIPMDGDGEDRPEEIKNFIKKYMKVIIKPIHSYSGNDIHLLNKFNSKLINKFIKKHDHIMCQKFLPKINKGDKRVFIINGKVCGAISRVPKKGSYLSNMSKGAKPININLTKQEYKISKLIAKDLKKENIYFAGIDFIDQKLNGDINVTSPTGLKTYFDLSGINLAKTFWKELKA